MKVSSCASSNISLKENYKDLRNTPYMKSTKIKQPVWKNLLTVSSFMQTAATGAAWPRSCRTNTSLLRSHNIHVLSRDPLTMMLYDELAARQMTGSVCPYNGCFRVRALLSRLRDENSQTFTTCALQMNKIYNSVTMSWNRSHASLQKLLRKIIVQMYIKCLNLQC